MSFYQYIEDSCIEQLQILSSKTWKFVKMLRLCTFLLCITVLGIVNCMNDTVVTKTGVIRGKLQKTIWYNKSYYSYKGIPYGKAPVGELRFKVLFFILLKNNKKHFGKQLSNKISFITIMIISKKVFQALCF